MVERSLAGSLNLGVYAPVDGGGYEQVALARVVTDDATFAWICDVFVDDGLARPRHRQLADARVRRPS